MSKSGLQINLEAATAPGVIGGGFVNLYLRVIEMQLLHFQKGTTESLLKHLQKEVTEAIENPDDDMEWGDLQILLMAAAWRRGITPWDLIQFANAKMDINERRDWPKEPDDDGIYHHNKTEPKEQNAT